MTLVQWVAILIALVYAFIPRTKGGEKPCHYVKPKGDSYKEAIRKVRIRKLKKSISSFLFSGDYK